MANVMPNLGAMPGDVEVLVELVRAAIPEGVRVVALIIDTFAPAHDRPERQRRRRYERFRR